MATAPDTRSAVDKAFSLLRCFSPNDASGVGVSELARRAELSKSTAHRLLAMLVANGAVERADDVYRLGPLCFELTQQSVSESAEMISEVLTPHLAALFEQTRHTVQLGYLEGTEVVYVNKLFSAQRVSSPSRIGGRAPAVCTGIGKALLAFDQTRLESALQRGLPKWTPYTITDPEELRQELDQVRLEGFAYDRQEISLGLSCIAAPIFGRNNQAVAAMSISGHAAQFNPDLFAHALRRTCAAASKSLLSFQRQQERKNH